MAAALELGVQEGVHDILGQVFAHDAGAHGQHVGVVVPPGEGGGQGVAAQGAADAPDLVGGDGDADAGGADDDAPLALAGGHGLGGGLAEGGVVAALGAVGAEVLTGDALGGQIGLDVLLQGIPAVIRSDCDHSDVPPSVYVTRRKTGRCLLALSYCRWFSQDLQGVFRQISGGKS